MMKFTVLMLVVISAVANCCDECTKGMKEEPVNEAKQGLDLVLHAIRSIVFGEPDPAMQYKDIFVDTSKGLLKMLDSSPNQATLDEAIRIFIQTVVILVADRRPDLIPDDFRFRHEEFGQAVSEINRLLDILAHNGSLAITVNDMKPLVQAVTSDNFWSSLFQMRQEVNELMDEEAKNKQEKIRADNEANQEL